jgi:hypothetical protein
MAYSVTNSMTVFGNKRVNAMYVVADAASDTVDSGLDKVDFVTMTPVSMGTAAIKVKANLTAASAAANGSIGISSAVNGDVFWLVAYGH